MIDTQHEKMGTMARRVRLSLRLTQQQLAVRTGITKEAVYLFEHNLPVYLDARRRILKELWTIKTYRQSGAWHN
jgi:transcriptional regulator with XRE-family HTH domain